VSRSTSKIRPPTLNLTVFDGSVMMKTACLGVQACVFEQQLRRTIDSFIICLVLFMLIIRVDFRDKKS
jgi:hypothetical protein